MSDRIKELPEMPDIFRKMVILLMKRHRKASTGMILNMVICKTAFALCSKRIKYREIKNTGFPNWYTIIFAPSGCGKDRINDDLDKYFFKNFRLWFDQKAIDWYNEQVRKIESIAEDLFQDTKSHSETKKKAFIKDAKEKIRPLVFEVYNGTAEGIFEEAKVRSKSDIGAILITITEFSKYFLNSKTEDKQFFSFLLIAYGGKFPSKCTKGDKRENDIIGVPLNCLLMCDYSLFEHPKAKQDLMLELQTGFARRAIITFIPHIVFENDFDAETSLKNDYIFFEQASFINEEFISIFSSIQDHIEYNMPDDVLLFLKKYKYKLEQEANTTENELLRKEILDRELKTIKLATIFAPFNHSEKIITLTDVKQAISVIEYLSKDFRMFVGHKPKRMDKYDELFNFFLENLDKKFNRMHIREKAKQFGFTLKNFKEDLNNALVFVKELANESGYNLFEEPYNNNTGMYYWLSKKVNDDELVHCSLNKLVSNNLKNPQNVA